MDYLKQTVKVTQLADLQPDYSEGTLILSDSQAVIDECVNRNQPVAAFEHDGVKGLKCPHILLDVDDVDDEIFENIYRRCKDIPWNISETKRTFRRPSRPRLPEYN